MKTTKTLILVCAACFALAACDNSNPSNASEAPNDPPATQQTTSLPPVKALPFRIEEVMFSDMFEGGLKLAKVYVQIKGGSPQEWAATSVSIAEKVATFNADAI